MLDGILLEKEGIPTVVISTDAFVQQCKTMASAHSLDDFTFTEVKHPIATATVAELQTEANKVINDVINILVTCE